MLEKGENKEYLPMEGLKAFREATLSLLLGDGNPAVKAVCTPTSHPSINTAPYFQGVYAGTHACLPYSQPESLRSSPPV